MKTYPCPNSDGITGCKLHLTYGLHDIFPPKRYVLNRKQDISGVSGIGIVAEAVEFASGKVIVSWLVPANSLSIHDSMVAAKEVHGHDGATEFQLVENQHEATITHRH